MSLDLIYTFYDADAHLMDKCQKTKAVEEEIEIDFVALNNNGRMKSSSLNKQSFQ